MDTSCIDSKIVRECLFEIWMIYMRLLGRVSCSKPHCYNQGISARPFVSRPLLIEKVKPIRI